MTGRLAIDENDSWEDAAQGGLSRPVAGSTLGRSSYRISQAMAKSSFSSRRRFLAPSLMLPLLATSTATLSASPSPAGKGGILVAFFSRSGNTRVIAGQIQRARAGTLFEIEPANAYPEDYLQTVEQARQERDRNIRPALKGTVPDMADFDTVFLGFPGKTIIPFITHGGYGVGKSLSVLAAHAPGAKLFDAGLVMQADQERATMNRVNEWLGKLKKMPA
jgi:flavodoxin